MKITTYLIPALLFITHQKAFSQCTASITNIPHGDCEHTDIELMASGGGTANGFTYLWTGPANYTSNSQSLIIYYAPASASGIYKVSITDPSGCTSSDSLQIIKHAVPSVYTGGDAGGCVGTTTYIYANDYSGDFGPYTYRWDHGETTQSLAIIHGGGSYPAPACMITNAYGCSAYNYTTFMIFSKSTPDAPVIEPLGATTFCKGGNVALTTPNVPDLTYQWMNNGIAVSGATANQTTVSQKGNYILKASNNMGCSASSNTIHITVHANPEAKITVVGSLNLCGSDSTLLTATPGTNLTYQWKKHISPIAGATLSSYYAKSTGNFRVVVTNQFGCSKTSGAVSVVNNCKLENEEIASVKSNHVFPNPSKDVFNLEIAGGEGNTKVLIADMTGRTVDEITVLENETMIQFGEKLSAGIYTVAMMRAGTLTTERIIKTE